MTYWPFKWLNDYLRFVNSLIFCGFSDVSQTMLRIRFLIRNVTNTGCLKEVTSPAMISRSASRIAGLLMRSVDADKWMWVVWMRRWDAGIRTSAISCAGNPRNTKKKIVGLKGNFLRTCFWFLVLYWWNTFGFPVRFSALYINMRYKYYIKSVVRRDGLYVLQYLNSELVCWAVFSSQSF